LLSLFGLVFEGIRKYGSAEKKGAGVSWHHVKNMKKLIIGIALWVLSGLDVIGGGLALIAANFPNAGSLSSLSPDFYYILLFVLALVAFVAGTVFVVLDMKEKKETASK
jgi:hypothetical protein